VIETHWLKEVFDNREVTRVVSYLEGRFEMGPVQKFF
jgi:hypothetical protein